MSQPAEIGAVVIDVMSNSFLGEFHEYVNPTRRLSPKFVEKNNYYANMRYIVSAPSIIDALDKLYAWLEHNERRHKFRFVSSKYAYLASDAAFICTWDAQYLAEILPRETSKKGFYYRDYLKHWIDLQEVVEVYEYNYKNIENIN